MSEVTDILTIAEVAERLRCSKAHVCNVINGRVNGVPPLPAIHLGRRKLVRLAALQSWLEQSERAMIPPGIDAVDASKGQRIDA
jgi:excisionase family DNA binding protein